MALLGICFLNKTKTSSVTRASSDRLLDPLFASWPLGTVLLAVWGVGGVGGGRRTGRALLGLELTAPAALRAGQPSPPRPPLLQLGIFIPCQ